MSRNAYNPCVEAGATLPSIRRWEASAIDRFIRWPMLIAAALVVPDLILEERPLRSSWHAGAVVGDWLIWLVFLMEFTAIMLFAYDWQSWLRRYPLAPAMLLLTPPFAPAAVQGVRAFRLLRVLRVARGFQLFSSLLTINGLKYVLALDLFIVLGGGTVFADVETHGGHVMSSWNGIYWAIGTLTTAGGGVSPMTDAGRAIAIVVMIVGIGTFSLLTGVLAHRLLAHGRQLPATGGLSTDKAIMARLDELSSRLDALQSSLAAFTLGQCMPDHEAGEKDVAISGDDSGRLRRQSGTPMQRV
jgi:voltage-gated potassium channel